MTDLFNLFSNKVKNFDEERDTSLSSMLTAIEKIIKQILTIIARRLRTHGNKNGLIEIIAKITLLWMEWKETHEIQGLIRGLKRWYSRGKGKSPLEAEEVWKACEEMRWIVREVLKGDGESVALLLNVLFVFYMGENRRRRMNILKKRHQNSEQVEEESEDEDDGESSDSQNESNESVDDEVSINSENENKVDLDGPLEFELFAHFVSKFLITIDFVDSDVIGKASIVTKTLVTGLKNLRGFIPYCTKKARKAYICKVIRRLLAGTSNIADLTPAQIREISLRSTRLCLFYHSFLKFFLSDSTLTKYITNAIIESGEDFENSELIQDLERLMNAGFEFDLEIEKIEVNIRQSKSGKKLKIFDRLKKVCKVNVELISKFIPIEIYPLFLKKRLEIVEDPEAENKKSKKSQSNVPKANNDLDTLSRFTNAFIDRIPDAKMSEKFKQYFTSAYNSFLKYSPIMNITSGNLTSASKFVQSFFTCLSLVHQKLPTFSEHLVAEHYSKMLTIIQK